MLPAVTGLSVPFSVTYTSKIEGVVRTAVPAAFLISGYDSLVHPVAL